MTDKKEIGQRIRCARQGRYTQAGLADQLGVSKTLISKWEAGERQPTLLRLRQLSRLLERPLSYFVPGSYMGIDAASVVGELAVYPLRGSRFSKGTPVGELGDLLVLDKNTVALRVQDDGLIHAGYKRGDLLLLQPRRTIRDEDLIAIRENGSNYRLIAYKDVPQADSKSEDLSTHLKVTAFFRTI